MKTGRTLTQLAQELERQNSSKRDFVAQTAGLELELVNPEIVRTPGGMVKEGFDTVVIDKKPSPASPVLAMRGLDERFAVTRHTHAQIATHLDIPKKHYDTMLREQPDLLSVMVNTLFRRKPAARMIRTLDGNARAFLSNRYRAIDNYQIASLAIESMVESQAVIASCEVTESKLYIKALFPKTEAEVKKGDPVRAGVMITNSEIGMGRMAVLPLIERLVCLNGLVMQDSSIKRTHLGARIDADEGGLAAEYRQDTMRAMDHALALQIRDTMKALASPEKIFAHVERLKATTERLIEGDPVAAVQMLQKNAGLNDNDRGGILRHLIQGGDLSQWGLVNAVTRYSQDVESYDRATDMEILGGQIVELSPTDWRTIATAAA